MAGVIVAPVLEHVPKELEVPDWTLLRPSTPPTSASHTDLKKRIDALAKSLTFAHSRLQAQEAIIEGQTAQLVLQNMGMEAMNRTLHKKEKPKNSDRTAMFPKGFGRHATDLECIQQKRLLEDERKKSEVDKAARKVSKQTKKAAKDRLEEQWKEVCAVHEEAVDSWKARCERLKEGGAAAKDLPKKPKRVLKASLEEEHRGAQRDQGEDGSNDESESDEN